MKNNKSKKQRKEIKKTEKALQKEKAGKNLSLKEREILRLLRSKLIYDKNSPYTLKLKNVKKSFVFKQILKGVTFEIKKGERVALVGKNGAGKSTLINVISQQLKISEGEILYGYASNRLESLELIGIQFQSLNYPEGFVVKDVIHFFNVSVEKNIRMSKIELSKMISMFGIEKFLDQKIDRLSGGQQQRINILLAMIKKPKLLILDEISNGLDVESSEQIKKYILNYLDNNPETSLLLISHSDEEVREIAERVVVLENGIITEKFLAKELTKEKFFEITSREPKLTKLEMEKSNLESNKMLKKLERHYNIKESRKIINKYKDFKRNIMLKAFKIENNHMNNGNIIEINDLSKTYNKRVGAVKDVFLTIKDGERVSITGPNGSGKTTLVETIAKIRKFDNDFVKFKNKFNLAKFEQKNNVIKMKDDIKIKLNSFKLNNKPKKSEIDEIRKIKKNSNQKIKELKHKLNDINKNDENYKSVSLKTKQEIKDLKNNSKNDILKILNEHISKFNNEYKNFENNLKKEYDSELILLQKKLEKSLENITLERQESKNVKGKKLIDSYLYNDEKILEKYVVNNYPKISYSFAQISNDVKNEIGVQFQYASFPIDMSVLDVILFFARTNEKFLTKEEMINAVKVFKLEKLLKIKAHSLSGGERQRLNVLLAIMKKPKILILDEISTGLDVDSIVKIDKFIKDYLDSTNATLILISHNYSEVHSLTNKLIVMKYGKLAEIIETNKWSLVQTKEKMRNIYKGGDI